MSSRVSFLPGWCRLIGITLLILLNLAVYSNSFQATWQFDDKPNIINNHYLHLRDLTPASLIQTFYTNPTDPATPGKRLYRPIAFLTFALNWYLGQDRVVGYHVVNVLIHCLTSVFLFLAVYHLFGAPNLYGKIDKRNRFLIALISAVLWSLNPIQTQAVTYIVQRMAAMAAMFYLLSMLFYIQCRLSKYPRHRIPLMLGCILSFLLAWGSKENAVALPAALLLIEIIFFLSSGSSPNARIALSRTFEKAI